jgi:hypothetical protein
MKLLDRIKTDRLDAFKNKEHIKRNILNCVIKESCKETQEPRDKVILDFIELLISEARTIQDKTNERDYDFFQASREIEILSVYRSGGSGLP